MGIINVGCTSPFCCGDCEVMPCPTSFEIDIGSPTAGPGCGAPCTYCTTTIAGTYVIDLPAEGAFPPITDYKCTGGDQFLNGFGSFSPYINFELWSGVTICYQNIAGFCGSKSNVCAVTVNGIPPCINGNGGTPWCTGTGWQNGETQYCNNGILSYFYMLVVSFGINDLCSTRQVNSFISSPIHAVISTSSPYISWPITGTFHLTEIDTCSTCFRNFCGGVIGGITTNSVVPCPACAAPGSPVACDFNCKFPGGVDLTVT